ncbi:MAG: hypothetical protein ACKV2Q_03305 [Planctomycetaceae bacterium]
MTKVIFSDWQMGFQKVAFNKLLRSRCGLTLSQAIDAVGTVLKRKPLELSVAEPTEAADLVHEAAKLGAIGQVAAASAEPRTSLVG